jgi:succinate dehydrogenase/fumarate reductase-like Fe-S protein
MKHEIHALWNAKSKQELLVQMQSIYTEYPELKNWLKSKEKGWILSGLIPEQTKILIKWCP